MAVSLTSIQVGIIQTINALLGKDSCPTRQLFTSPVIKSNSGGVRPDFPFVSVGKVTMPNYGISGTTVSYFNDAGNYEHLTDYKATLAIQVHGDGDDDVEEIAKQIRGTFFRPYGMELLHENTNAGLLNISGISFAYNYLNTEYEEIAKLIIDMSVVDVFEETDATCPSTGEIVTITQTGELIDSEEDTTPLDINTTVP